MKSNREHSFDFELAEILSIEKAIILKNIHYWVREHTTHKNKAYFKSEKYWMNEGIRSMAVKYKYMKRASIGRWLKELEADGWIEVYQGTARGCNDYRRPGPVFEQWNEFSTVSQNGTHFEPKWDGDRLKMGQELAQNGTLNINSNVEGNVEGNNSSAQAPEAVEPEPEKVTWSWLAKESFENVFRAGFKELGVDSEFNWGVLEAENWNSLKMLKTKCVEPDFQQKHERAPTTEECVASLTAVFWLVWFHMADIAKRANNNTPSFTPTIVYRNYNNAKSNRNARAKLQRINEQQHPFGSASPSGNSKFDPAVGY